MALATYEDLETRLGITLTEDEQPRADDLLSTSSELVMDIIGGDEADAPVLAKIIAIEVVIRVWLNPANAQSESIGTASVSYAPQQGLQLTKDEIRALQGGSRGSSAYTFQLR